MPSNNDPRLLYVMGHAFLGVGLFYIYIFHISTVFEIEYNFSQLSKIGREVIFKSDHALYYSYYKTIAEAPDFSQGLESILNDNYTEYPNTINAIQKFHIYPEIIIGFLYKQFIHVTQYFGIKTRYCWLVESNYHYCEGLGEPIYFYLEAVWFMGGLTVFLLYIYAAYISRNIISGLTAVAYYIIIHNDATQIHRNPAARDNFAFPFILWQMLYLTMCIDKYKKKLKSFSKDHLFMIAKLTILSTLANLSWQFSQYIFETQSIIMYILLQFGMINSSLFTDYICSQILTNSISYYIMFENKQFFLSFHNPMLFGLLLFATKFKIFRPMEGSTKKPSDATVGTTSTTQTIIFRYFDSFMFVTIIFCELTRALDYINFRDSASNLYKDVILTKLFLKPPTFSTLIYLCQPDMWFIDYEILKTYNKLFVGKFFGFYIVNFLSKWLQKRREIEENDKDKIERSKNYLIEDFLEENRVSMKDIVNPATDKEIKICLEQLKKCNYDYEKYKREKRKTVKPKTDERLAFLNDVKKFKEQISEKEKGNGNKIAAAEKEEENKGKSSEDLSKDASPTEDAAAPEESENSTKKEDEPITADPNVYTPSQFLQSFYFYNILQTIIFAVMAGLVLKLKFIFTPFMCLMGSSFPPRNWFPNTVVRYWMIYLFIVLCSIAEIGVPNLQSQYQPKEKIDQNFENVMHWINLNTEANAVFAGPANLVTTILLTTKRPIVNHPRFEYYEMRERTRLVYSIFSRQPDTQIFNQLTKLKVQYVLLPLNECVTSTSQKSCDLADIWNYVEPENRNNAQLCVDLFKKLNPNFLRVFINEQYLILKIFSQSIQLELNKNVLTELNM